MRKTKKTVVNENARLNDIFRQAFLGAAVCRAPVVNVGRQAYPATWEL
jgi:hypothetical protein